VDRVLEEIARVRRPGQMIFFIDDNLTSGLDEAKELMEALVPLKIRWVSQSAINVCHDEDTLDMMRRSGCQGVLIGFESLHADSLKQMNKSFNLMADQRKLWPTCLAINFPSTERLSLATTMILRSQFRRPSTSRSSMVFSSQRLITLRRSRALRCMSE
jgi:hypothetical protein